MGKKRVIKKSGEAVGAKEAAAGRPAEIKADRRIAKGRAHIQATYNNTIVTIADDKGNVLGQSSAGSLGFSGAKKATPFAAARVAETIAEKARKFGLEEIAVFVKGVGSGRDSAVRALINYGLNVVSIKDVTPLPHNGPRPKKARRV